MSNLYYFCIIISFVSQKLFMLTTLYMYLKLNFVTIRFDDTVPHY